MSQALYRKYRPQLFEDLVGQNPIKITLQNEVEQGRITHAYLFSGPRGIGKTTTARLLAKAANCTNRQGSEPCNKCESCLEFAAGRALDLIEIDAASHTGVDNVRENIIENARFTPQRAKYKVFIIDEVHMLSVSAFNALLKTLEEPPEHVIFILATTEVHHVPETIKSRCQRFDFKRVGVDELVKRLKLIAKCENIKIEESILKEVARRSDGSVRDAEVLLGQIMSLGDKKITEETASLVLPRSDNVLIVEFFSYIIKRDTLSAITLINKLVDEGVNIQDFTKDLVEFFRKVLLYKISGSLNDLAGLEVDDKTVKDIKSYLDVINVNTLVQIIEIINVRSREFKNSQIVQLPLELAVVELCETGETNKREPDDSDKKPDTPNQPGLLKPDDSVSHKPSQFKPDDSVSHKPSQKKSLKALRLKDIHQAWPEIVNKLIEYNHSISLSLKVGLPVSIEGDKIVIGFRHKFHADRIKERKVKSAIEDVISQVLGAKLRLGVAVVTEEEFNKIEAKISNTSGQEVWNQALQVFGGEVVESDE